MILFINLFINIVLCNTENIRWFRSTYVQSER